MRKTSNAISDFKCWKMLNALAFYDDLNCPSCQAHMRENYANRYVWCRLCRKKYRATAHSIRWLYGMKLTPRQFFIMLWCWRHNIDQATVQLLARVSSTTSKRWYGRFDSVWASSCPMFKKLILQVEGIQL